MVKIEIDGNAFEVDEGMTILKAAGKAGISIPHFCYHPAFLPEGSCRMCLIEIEGLPKLELACSTKVREGMKIFTQSPSVVEARKGVLEFLLAEHPLDCPICDKAGDCKLQDYYEEFGLFDSQFQEQKDRKEKKVLIGKNLILDRERCILCTRCVRFLSQETKTHELGVFNRGAHSEIAIFDGSPVDNLYSGNLAEICPVGAITDIDFRFKTRAWFLRSGDSICPHCSRGCNISVEYHRGFPRFPVTRKVFRIKSRQNDLVNGYWICDVGRYGYSYIDEGRARKITANGSINNAGWDDALSFLAEKLIKLYRLKKASQIGVVLNSWLSNEELFLVKKIFQDDLGVERIFFADPPEGTGDRFLLTSDRCPNKRGAQEVSFKTSPLDLKSLSENTGLLIVFGHYLAENFNGTELRTALANIPAKVLLTSHKSALNSHVNLVLPVSVVPEKGGSFVNGDGIVQKFSPALSSEGESRAEWEVLVNLAKKLAIRFEFYRPFSSPENIFQQMRKEIPYFEKKSD